jgi:hypothetical protein
MWEFSNSVTQQKDAGCVCDTELRLDDSFPILCFVDRASLYNLINKANLVHSFS